MSAYEDNIERFLGRVAMTAGRIIGVGQVWVTTSCWPGLEQSACVAWKFKDCTQEEWIAFFEIAKLTAGQAREHDFADQWLKRFADKCVDTMRKSTERKSRPC